MKENSPDHILRKLKILASFDVARKIKGIEVKKIRDEVKKKNLTSRKEKSQVFNQMLDEYTNKILQEEPIPGLLNAPISNTRTNELLKYSLYLGKEIKKLNLTKEEESFLIVSLVKMLELSIKDFKNFTKQQEDNKEDSEDSEDGEE